MTQGKEAGAGWRADLFPIPRGGVLRRLCRLRAAGASALLLAHSFAGRCWRLISTTAGLPATRCTASIARSRTAANWPAPAGPPAQLVGCLSSSAASSPFRAPRTAAGWPAQEDPHAPHRCPAAAASGPARTRLACSQSCRWLLVGGQWRREGEAQVGIGRQVQHAPCWLAAKQQPIVGSVPQHRVIWLQLTHRHTVQRAAPGGACGRCKQQARSQNTRWLPSTHMPHRAAPHQTGSACG